MKYRHQRELVEGLRALADFVEAHPELPIRSPGFTLASWVYDEKDATAKEQLAIAAKAMGSASKIYTGGWFDLRKTFGPITFEFTTNRANVCRRVVTGERVIPAETKVVQTDERVEEIVEWVCDEPLLQHDSEPTLASN